MRLAAFRLALIYQDGRGGACHNLAVCCKVVYAAEEGLAEAQFNLGYLYERGIGVKADGKSSVLVRGARRFKGCTRHIKSRHAVCDRSSVERDDAKALFWLSLVNDEDAEVEAVRRLVGERGGPAAAQSCCKNCAKNGIRQR